jgi:hypothetical protein
MGAEVLGVDLSLPLDKDHFETILEAFHRHLLLVFPGGSCSATAGGRATW